MANETNKPKTAITGPTFMPHNSKIATIPKTNIRIFKPLSVQSTNGLEILSSNFFIKKEKGTTN